MKKDNRPLESKIREIVARSNQDRLKLANVGRIDNNDPVVLARQGQIKTKIIDEASDEIEEEYKDPDKHYAKQSKPMQDAINLHLRKGKSYWDAARAAKVHVKEEAEQIDEISKQALGRYVKAAPKSAEQLRASGREHAKLGKDAASAGAHGTAGDLYYKAGGMLSKAGKRDAMHAKAVDKLTKEEVEQIDEVSSKTVMNYGIKAAAEVGKGKLSTDKESKRMAGIKMADEKMRKKEGKSSTAKVAAEEVENIEEAKSSTLSLKAKQKSGAAREHKAKYGISPKRFAIKQEEPPTYSAADNKPRVMKKHKVDIHVHNTKTDKPHKYQDIVDAPNKHSAVFKTQIKYKKMGDKMGYVVKDVVHKGMVKEEYELIEAEMPPTKPATPVDKKNAVKDSPEASKMLTSPGKSEVDLKPTTDDRADADTNDNDSTNKKTKTVKKDTTNV